MLGGNSIILIIGRTLLYPRAGLYFKHTGLEELCKMGNPHLLQAHLSTSAEATNHTALVREIRWLFLKSRCGSPLQPSVTLTTYQWVWSTLWIPAAHRGACTTGSPPHWSRSLWALTWPGPALGTGMLLNVCSVLTAKPSPTAPTSWGGWAPQ